MSRLRGFLLGIRADDAGKLTGGSRRTPAILVAGACKQSHDLAPQFVERRQLGEGFDAVRIERRRSDRTAEDHELVVVLGVGDRHLRSRDRILAVGDAGRAFEEVGRCPLRPFPSERACKTVLRHLERGSGRAHARAEIAHLGDRHAGIVGDDHRAGLREDPFAGSSTTSAFSGFRPLCSPFNGLRFAAEAAISQPMIRPLRDRSALSNEALPQGSNPNCARSPCEIRFSPRLRWTFKSLKHSSGLGQVPAIVRRNSLELQCASALAAPTLPSAIFTPGPIVEEMEIFFM